MDLTESEVLLGLVGGLSALAVLYIAGGMTTFMFWLGFVVGVLLAAGYILYESNR
jgi:hypothetical protein